MLWCQKHHMGIGEKETTPYLHFSQGGRGDCNWGPTACALNLLGIWLGELSFMSKEPLGFSKQPISPYLDHLHGDTDLGKDEEELQAWWKMDLFFNRQASHVIYTHNYVFKYVYIRAQEVEDTAWITRTNQGRVDITEPTVIMLIETRFKGPGEFVWEQRTGPKYSLREEISSEQNHCGWRGRRHGELMGGTSRLRGLKAAFREGECEGNFSPLGSLQQDPSRRKMVGSKERWEVTWQGERKEWERQWMRVVCFFFFLFGGGWVIPCSA